MSNMTTTVRYAAEASAPALLDTLRPVDVRTWPLLSAEDEGTRWAEALIGRRGPDLDAARFALNLVLETAAASSVRERPAPASSVRERRAA